MYWKVDFIINQDNQNNEYFCYINAKDANVKEIFYNWLKKRLKSNETIVFHKFHKIYICNNILYTNFIKNKKTNYK